MEMPKGLAHYILQGHIAVLVEDFLEWARWYETADRRVALTKIGKSEVSTVFLGLDHNHGGGGPPLLFETLVFGGSLDGEMERYSTWEEAVAGHQEMIRRLQE